jgi:hypothetical protein
MQTGLDVATECSGCSEYLHVLFLVSGCPDSPIDGMQLKLYLKMQCSFFFFPFIKPAYFPESSLSWALDGCKNLMSLGMEGLVTQHGGTFMISRSFSSAYLHISNHMDCCKVHHLWIKRIEFIFFI